MKMALMDRIKCPAIETYARRTSQLIPVESKNEIKQNRECPEGEETKEDGRRRECANDFAG